MEWESMKCAKCGKEMTDDDGVSMTGISFNASVYEEAKFDFMKKQLGKYTPSKTYNFCFECWLDSLFRV